MFPINPKMNTVVLNSKVSYCQTTNIPIMEGSPKRININKKVDKYINIDKSHQKPINNMGRIFMNPYDSRNTGIPE